MDVMIRGRIEKKYPMFPALNFGVLQLFSVLFGFLAHLIDYEVAWNRLKQSGDSYYVRTMLGCWEFVLYAVLLLSTGLVKS